MNLYSIYMAINFQLDNFVITCMNFRLFARICGKVNNRITLVPVRPTQ